MIYSHRWFVYVSTIVAKMEQANNRGVIITPNSCETFCFTMKTNISIEQVQQTGRDLPKSVQEKITFGNCLEQWLQPSSIQQSCWGQQLLTAVALNDQTGNFIVSMLSNKFWSQTFFIMLSKIFTGYACNKSPTYSYNVFAFWYTRSTRCVCRAALCCRGSCSAFCVVHIWDLSNILIKLYAQTA